MHGLNWYWITWQLTAAPLMGLLVTIPFWRKAEMIFGNIFGSAVIFVWAISLDLSRVCRGRPRRAGVHRCRYDLLARTERLRAVRRLRVHRHGRGLRPVHREPGRGTTDQQQGLRSGVEALVSESEVRHQIPGRGIRLASLLLAHIFARCSLIAPREPGAAARHFQNDYFGSATVGAHGITARCRRRAENDYGSRRSHSDWSLDSTTRGCPALLRASDRRSTKWHARCTRASDAIPPAYRSSLCAHPPSPSPSKAGSPQKDSSRSGCPTRVA